MKIMLACQAGMSTSMVVVRMQQAAKEQGKDYEIWAVDQSEIANELGKFDVLLLGPQVRHILRRVKGEVGDQAVVDIINPMSYGRCDGAAILKQAEELLKGGTK